MSNIYNQPSTVDFDPVDKFRKRLATISTGGKMSSLPCCRSQGNSYLIGFYLIIF